MNNYGDLSHSGYEMWIIADGSSDKMQFPVLPEKLKVSRNGNNESVIISGVGETTVIQAPAADKIKFECFFPGAYFPGCQTETPEDPMTYVNKINEFMNSEEPVRFVVVSSGCSISDFYTVEAFEYWEEGGDVGTIQYSITLKSYKEVSSRSIKVQIENQKASIKKTETRVDNTKQPETYTVQPGDSMTTIAKKVTGDASQAKTLYQNNQKTVGANPNTIKAGAVISTSARKTAVRMTK